MLLVIVMRYALLPDPTRINPGFLKRDRVAGMGDSPAPANTTTGGFWPSIGSTFVDLTRTYAPGLINWGITGNAPQPVVTPSGNVAVIPGGTQTLQQATGGFPPWVIPAAIGAGVLLFFVARKK